MKSYTLVISDWRCGHFAPPESGRRLGLGFTSMLNDEGRMCCLGQFARQAGVSDNYLLGEDCPVGVADKMGRAYDTNFVVPASAPATEEEEYDLFVHTALANRLMNINDDEKTTIAEKVSAIREALESHGIQLQVIYPEGEIQ